MKSTYLNLVRSSQWISWSILALCILATIFFSYILRSYIEHDVNIQLTQIHLFKTSEVIDANYSPVWGILVAGVSFSFLLFFLIRLHFHKILDDFRITNEMANELSNQVEIANALNEKLKLQCAALNASTYATVITNAEAIVEWVNPAFVKLTGYDLSEVIGRKPKELVNSGKQEPLLYEQMWDTILAGKSWHGEIINRRKDGSYYDEEMTITPLMDEHGSITHFIAVKQEITTRKRAEKQLLESEDRFRFMLENSPIAVRITNIDTGIVQFANLSYAKLVSISREQIIGINPTHYYANPQDYSNVIEQLRDGKSVTNKLIEILVKSDRSETRWVLASYLPILYESKPAVLGWFYDITDRKHLEDQVQQLAYQDVLTSLPNRRLLNDRLIQAITASKRSALYGAVIMLDLDNFKPLNDTHGHYAGDLLLIEVARRLKNCVRDMDTVARLGGDEFVVMVSELSLDESDSRDQAYSIAEKIRVELSEPYEIKVHKEGSADEKFEHKCTASIGLVLFNGEVVSQDSILMFADSAMYQAKEGGRNRTSIYEYKSNLEAEKDIKHSA